MKLSRADKTYKVVCYAICGVIALASLYPLLYTVFLSLCSTDEFNAGGGLLMWWPQHPTLDAYRGVFGSGGYILRASGVSLARSLIGTALNVFFNICMGYALSRENLPGRKSILMFLIITILFGGGLIPGYLTVKQTGLLNSFWSLIVPQVVSAWNVLMFRQFFLGVPKELEESAMLDGAGEWHLMMRIIVPMSKAVVAAIGLFTFVGHWNSWFDAMIYLDVQHANLWPLQLFTINNFKNLAQLNSNAAQQQTATAASLVTPTTQKMALTVVTLLPVLVIYPLFLKYFEKGVYTGAVKG